MTTLKDLYKTREGKWLLTIETDKDLRGVYDRLQGKVVDVEITEHGPKRSKDSNRYMWELLGKLSNELNIDKKTLYREYIKNVGGNFQAVCVQNEAVDDLIKGWEHKEGLGWQTDTAESKIDGCTVVLLYYGSSMFDNKQMSRLIDLIVEDCKEHGIETLTPEEIAKLDL